MEPLEFANDEVGRIDNNKFDVMKIWCNEEAYFHLNGYVNKLNGGFGGQDNVILKSTVHCTLCVSLSGAQFQPEE
ncbi:hypothetical protein NPIL_471381 [Nephila pilipes]|uniref:Uncharacterized protein n=1 Tax=Nephila pilipes TaxID=299642 RepID=A0A8X6UHM0_NEPPI|nr:hypothetical protein NPIL_288671 [Nephila pilipes]GFU15782.1 hypothetical protein NPIL_471381 [Nephila pilipes]